MAPRARTLDAEPVPESDRAGDLPHPREQLELFGHAESCRALALAARSNQLHHAWLIAGPKGVGKATLAWRFTRALLAHGYANCPDDLAVDESHPIHRQIAALAHPDVLLLRRPWDFEKKRFKSDLPVDEVRRLRGFFSRHSTFGGARIAIIDSADDLNQSSQNALLKVLEEPPKNALLLLISNTPGGLLPTTRSRCRMLGLRKLDEVTMLHALTALRPQLLNEERTLISALADGAPGRAVSFAELGAASMYRDIVSLLRDLPRMDPSASFAFAERTARLPPETGIVLFSILLQQIEERLLRSAFAQSAVLTGEDVLFQRLRSVVRPERWARLWEELRVQEIRTDLLNLDKKQFVLNSLFAIEAAARP